MTTTIRWFSGARTRCGAASRMPTPGSPHPALRRLSTPRASSRAIASPLICPTCPKQSSRCSARRRSAPSGRPARPTSACKASSIVSDKSSPRCSLRSTAIGTTARSYRCSTKSPRWLPSCRRSSVWSSFLICSRRQARRMICQRCATASAGTIFSHRMPAERSIIRSCRSIIRCSCSIHLARPACRSALSMARAERCSSISRSICSTVI